PPVAIDIPNENSSTQWQSRLVPLDAWGTLAQAALLLNFILAAIAIALSARLFAAYSGLLVADHMDSDWVESLDGPIRRIFNAMYLFRFLTAALVITWMYKAYRNLPILGHASLDNKPIWIIVCWFVPLMNLFAPYQAVREIWRRSEPNLLAADSAQSASVVSVWWGAWILVMVLTIWSNQMNRNIETATDMVWATGSHLIYLAATAVAAALLMIIIAKINRRQLARY